MPLLDHFHPPLNERRPWESFQATWCGTLADHLNRDVLPAGFIALEQVSPGASIEIDVGTYAEEAEQVANGGGTATVVRTVWTPTAQPLVLPVEFPARFAVEVHATEGDRTLVGAIELVSPGNKDRAGKRRLFTAKCAGYLGRGVGLVIVDVVTSRHGNLHNELLQLLGLAKAGPPDDPAALYTVAYRPLRREGQDVIEAWPMRLAVGEVLPCVPLSLAADFCVAVDLDSAYQDACNRRRFEDVVP